MGNAPSTLGSDSSQSQSTQNLNGVASDKKKLSSTSSLGSHSPYSADDKQLDSSPALSVSSVGKSSTSPKENSIAVTSKTLMRSFTRMRSHSGKSDALSKPPSRRASRTNSQTSSSGSIDEASTSPPPSQTMSRKKRLSTLFTRRISSPPPMTTQVSPVSDKTDSSPLSPTNAGFRSLFGLSHPPTTVMPILEKEDPSTATKNAGFDISDVIGIASSVDNMHLDNTPVNSNEQGKKSKKGRKGTKSATTMLEAPLAYPTPTPDEHESSSQTASSKAISFPGKGKATGFLGSNSLIVGSPLTSSDHYSTSHPSSKTSKGHSDASISAKGEEDIESDGGKRASTPPVSISIQPPSGTDQSTSLLSPTHVMAAMSTSVSKSIPIPASKKNRGSDDGFVQPPGEGSYKNSPVVSSIPAGSPISVSKSVSTSHNRSDMKACREVDLDEVLVGADTLDIECHSNRQSENKITVPLTPQSSDLGRETPSLKISKASNADSDTQIVPVIINWTHGGKTVYVTGSFNQWAKKIKMNKSTEDFTALVEVPAGTHQFKFIVDNEWKCSEELPMEPDADGNMVNYLVVDDPSGDRQGDGLDELAHDNIQMSPVPVPDSPIESYACDIPNYISSSRIKKRPISMSMHNTSTASIPIDKQAIPSTEKTSSQLSSSLAQESTPAPSITKEASSSTTSDKKKSVRVAPPPVIPPHLQKVLLNTAPPKESARVDTLPVPSHVTLNHLYACSIRDGVMAVGCTTRYQQKYITTVLYKPVFFN